MLSIFTIRKKALISKDKHWHVDFLKGRFLMKKTNH